MDIHLESLEEDKRFNVKLQISLYNTARKVMREDKREGFSSYMDERVQKIRELLGLDEGTFRILEKGKVIFEVP